jgi:hypothetical protein
MIDIEDVKRLTLGPDDILVLQVKGRVSREQEVRMRTCFSNLLPTLKNKIMVVDESVTLAVLVPEEAKARAA